ncbi:MAG: GNAT family acetyltransferase [Alphaproteobacteria bacterium]|nr:MAG: GNAT family acetyltransferase [Alphaproteobacteria bacterium]
MIIEGSDSDLEAVVALWERCGLTRPWNDARQDYRTALGAPDAVVLLRKDGVRTVASVMVGFDGHRGWIYYLAVEAALQRQGLGREMMAAAEQWLRARGAPKLQLMVRDANAAALQFYERLGLEPQAVTVLGKRLD